MAAVPTTSVAGPAVRTSIVAAASPSRSSAHRSSAFAATSRAAAASSSSAISTARSSVVASPVAPSSSSAVSSGFSPTTRPVSSSAAASSRPSTPLAPALTTSTPVPSSTTVSSSAQSSSIIASGTSSVSVQAFQATDVPSSGSSTRSLSGGAIGGIVGGIAGAILILMAAGWIWRRRKTSRYRQEHPLPPPRDSFLPAAGVSRSKSGQLGEKYSSVGEKTYDRSLSALYVPPLPAHYPSYSRRQSSTSGLNQYSQQGSYTPSYDERYDAANIGPTMDSNSSSGPFLGGSVNGGSGSNSPAVRPQGSYGSLSGMARVDETEGTTLPPMAFPSEFGSRPVTPSGLGSRPVTPSGLGSESGRPRPVSTTSSHRISRIPPPSIQTSNLNEPVSEGASYAPPSAYGSAPSTPNSRSRQSLGNYASPPLGSIGRANSASMRSIALRMPAPLDPSTPRHGYLPSRQSSASIHGLNDFGVMNGRSYRGSRDGLSDVGLQAGGSVRHHASTASSAPSTRESGSGSGSGVNGRNETGSEPDSEQNGLIMNSDKQV